MYTQTEGIAKCGELIKEGYTVFAINSFSDFTRIILKKGKTMVHIEMGTP